MHFSDGQSNLTSDRTDLREAEPLEHDRREEAQHADGEDRDKDRVLAGEDFGLLRRALERLREGHRGRGALLDAGGDLANDGGTERLSDVGWEYDVVEMLLELLAGFLRAEEDLGVLVRGGVVDGVSRSDWVALRRIAWCVPKQLKIWAIGGVERMDTKAEGKGPSDAVPSSKSM